MKKYRTHGISFPDESLLEAAKRKAEEEDRSLSKYICRLIEKDIALNDAAKCPPPPRPPQKVSYSKKSV